METEKNYYTPKETRELLGMTYSGLQNQINIGNLHPITPPGRRQKVYPKKEVDELKAELEAWSVSRQLVKSPPTIFVKATREDMPQAVQLASVYGGHLTIPLEKRLAWLDRNDEIDYFLKQDDYVVGYISLVPLNPETIEDLLHARRFAKDLEANDILPYAPGQPVDIYCMAIFLRAGISKAQKGTWGELLLLGTRRVIVDLGRRGIIIRHFQAHSSMPDGINLMRHIGFTETVSSIPGMHDFLIDVEQSGLPFIMDYKKALNNWQQQHHRQEGLAARKPSE